MKEGYGLLVAKYCKLLITKLEFHEQNFTFPGTLRFTNEELANYVGEIDLNIWYVNQGKIYSFAILPTFLIDLSVIVWLMNCLNILMISSVCKRQVCVVLIAKLNFC